MMRLDLQRIGAACAMVYAVLIIVSLALFASSGVPNATGAAEFLPMLASHQAVALTVSILFIVMPLLIAIAGMGFYRMLRGGGPIAWLALFGFVGGGLSILYRGFTWVAMTLELAPAYVHASATQQPTLAAVGDTLLVFSAGATLVGAVLVAGIGVLVCAVLMYRMNLGSRWLAWLGVFAALAGGWLTLLTKVSDVAATASGIGNLAFFIWMVVVGVIAWRRSATADQFANRTTITQQQRAMTS